MPPSPSHIPQEFPIDLPTLFFPRNSYPVSSRSIIKFHQKKLTGWWFQPLWKIWKSNGITIPNTWKNKLDDGWPESEKDVFQAALRMVVVKDSRWIVGEFYMSYGKIWCEKVRLIKKRIFGKGHQMTCVLQPQRERGGRDKERERKRERERESKRERENERGG